MNLNVLLPKEQKKKFIILAILLVIASFFEMIGVSLIVPLISATTSKEITNSTGKFVALSKYFSFSESKDYVIALAVLMIIIYVFKNLFLLLVYKYQAKFIVDGKYDLQDKMLEMYLDRDYEYFLNVDSGDIIRNINTDSNNTYSIVQSIANILKNVVLCIVLIITMLVINPVIALAALLVGLLLIGTLYFFMQPILKKSGKQMVYAISKAYKWLIQSIEGIKSVKVTKSEHFFLQQYSSNNDIWRTAERNSQLLNKIPSIIIEFVCMVSFLVAIIIIVSNGNNLVLMLPSLSAFAVAIIKMLPGISGISTDLNTIEYNKESLNKLVNTINSQPKYMHKEGGKRSDKKLKICNCISLKNITYRYPFSERFILENANMIIPVGKSIGIIGESGAGKTTTMDILLGLLIPQQGNVEIDGNAIRLETQNWLECVGYIPQNIFLLDDTIRANVAFGIKPEDVDNDRVKEAIIEAQLEKFINELPMGIDTEVGERGIRLSGGQRQRLGIARALYNNPDVLFFDEATSALDVKTEDELMSAIDELHGRKTIIIVAHRERTIRGCDYIYKVEDGKITELESRG